MKNKIFIFSILLMSISAKAQSLKYWYIADAKIPCQYGNTVMSCLQVRTSPDSVWRPFKYEIEGFIWEPGVEAMIELTETVLPVPGPDGAPAKYKYIRTVEVKNTVLKQKVILGSTRWNLINIQSSTTPIPRVKMLKAWMEFNLDSNTAGGFGGCNSFGGNAEVLEGEINFGPIMSTLKSCTNDSVEKIFLESMQGNTQFFFRNRMLFITCQNGYTLHFRPAQKIDSLISELSKPHIYKGNSFAHLKNGAVGVTLDDIKEAANKNYIMIDSALTEKEKLSIDHKLINTDTASNVAEIHILKKPGKSKDIFHAILIFRDGTTREFMIRHVL